MNTHRWYGWSSAQRGTPPRPILKRGIGCEVWDIHGRRYLDGVAAAANTPFGHAHPELTKAVTTQLGRIAHFDETAAGLGITDKLTSTLGQVTGMGETVYVNSGSEAVEAALRITMDYWKARGQTHRDTVIAFQRGYHGCTAATQALSGLPILHNDAPFGPRMLYVPLDSTDTPGGAAAAYVLAGRFAAAIDAAGADRVAAVIVEPFLNVGGGIALPEGFLAELRTLTTDADILLIVDEVFTGFGRSGTAFATSEMTTRPDILAMSKGMAGGVVPMGATCVRPEIRDAFGPALLRYGHTTSGHGLASAAALTTLRLLATGGLTQAANAAAWFATNFVPGSAGLPGIVAARSYGVVAVLECDSTERALTIVARALEAGLIVGWKSSSVMLTPALNAKEHELEEMSFLLAEAVLAAAGAVSAGSESRR
ncbi:aminotransferase class III-fold pyridoxal phosphate-dependent enzyme [Nocardia noduli]|uniref:aminotransferase class III-fold pyridoxal phosphate-dependent enzyme n=1 Tax=Nocardia noduli TaxID=2815722 RepID=UPI001C234AF7|nr:aminotransferase class III-fold pyridoxal phosphate-dependent enzyme [Nocardia noduli]